ncbi:MAG: 5,10-methylenetetrahydrofolate reductase [Methanobacteriota archaeon]|nr:MAG: 5,10-methylenetetrahydrofolate reductase [Euryarchaeota archaeon]
MKLTDMFETSRFVVTCEVEPPKGVNVHKSLEKAEKLRKYIDAFNVTDNQRAVMRVGSLAMCKLLKEKGLEPIYQLTCRDRNRIALQSDLLSAAVLGIENVLILTGDHTSMGDHPEAKPVFDLDSVSLLRAAKMLKNGYDMAGNKLDGFPELCVGAVATPGIEPFELHMIKLQKKIREGAQFIQTQTIYEPEIFEKFIDALKESNLRVPVMLGHVMLKSAKMARFMNKNIPGVRVPEGIIRELDGLPPDRLVEKSISISIDLINEMKHRCQGVHLMPMGWEKHVPRVVEAIRK